jgi:pimeloyl-ACP methyl ester carboxylesterase
MKALAGLLLAAGVLLLDGCAAVTVRTVSPSDYLAQRRSDILTSGKLSTSSLEVLRVLGLRPEACRRRPAPCRQAILDSSAVSDERRLSALSEVWLETAIGDEKQESADAAAETRMIEDWLEVARYATAYLFFSGRSPQQRAFENRQTQVRDYYNYAVQKAVTAIFKRMRKSGDPSTFPVIGDWRFSSDVEPMQSAGPALPHDLIPADSLRFSGLRNIYRRDGFGAELVAALAPGREHVQPKGAPPYREMAYPVVTALLVFKGSNLDELLDTRDVQLVTRDPYRSQSISFGGEDVPLAANFTAGYGLWLARSGFARQSLSSLLGRRDGIVQPRIYLMQPYDPQRRIIIMLHGLASSPEAWVNVANEVLGDEVLRRSYQIWQVYYPTNAPLALNNLAIHRAIEQTLARLDPGGTAPASQDVTLIGHSMGGMLARLLVSSSDERVLNRVLAAYRVDSARRKKLAASLGPYLHFEPLPQVSTAIFIAAPHRGTPFANRRIARWLANLVTLPLSMLQNLDDVSRQLAQLQPSDPSRTRTRIPNSIDNLSEHDKFIRATTGLPISGKVRYHSIIGNDTPERPLAESSDGLVPYWSAHLDGAESELIVRSGHSVQTNPRAIIEIRRILKQQLRNGD